MKVREHDFMGEERGPFKSGGAVGVGAADEFVLAIGQPDKFGLSELANEVAAPPAKGPFCQPVPWAAE